jgi:Trypsin-co-occurring domain 2
MYQIELADMLVGLRKELVKAQVQASKEPLKFRLDDIEVELKMGITKKDAVKGGLKFWVIDAGGEVSNEDQQLQTLRLKLTPITVGGEDTLVSDQDTK